MATLFGSAGTEYLERHAISGNASAWIYDRRQFRKPWCCPGRGRTGDYVMTRLVCFLYVISAVILASSAATGRERSAWSDRGIFVFGNVSLDFQHERERFGPFFSNLEDCSTDELLCAKGDLVQIVLPRQCGGIEAGSWRMGDITSSVLGFFDVPLTPHNPRDKMYFLGDPERRWIVYKYSERFGVKSIYFDPLKRMDLVKLASSGDLDDRRVLETVKNLADEYQTKANLLNNLITFDSFGACIRGGNSESK